MNQDQRKFLIERVEKTFRRDIEKINATTKLDKPSLNNYLIAAFLDGSVQFNDIQMLKEKMRARVLKMGAGNTLIEEPDRYSRRNNQNTDHTCEVSAEDLFVIPEIYLKALQDYEEDRNRILQEIAELEATKDTILLKIQIGSNQVLDRLVTEVDNLADLSIMNSQFLLGDAPKQLTNKK